MTILNRDCPTPSATPFARVLRAVYSGVVEATVPLIYAPQRVPARLSLRGRGLAMLVALASLAVLVTAVVVVPSSTGIGSHTSIGLAACGFEKNTGLPCMSCGMTTSFAWFVRGNILRSAYVQPMGLVLAVLTGTTFCAAMYVALSGRPAYRLLRLLPLKAILIGLTLLAFAAWGWKILLRTKGLDG